jgi:hypothetical protein
MITVDEDSVRIATDHYGLPKSLHIPISARDEAAIRNYVSSDCEVVASGSPNKALVVRVSQVPEVDSDLAIWRLPESAVLYFPQQLWVHVDYSGYRRAYQTAFPNQQLKGLVLDHVMNRRVARLKGFKYLRIVPVSLAANSSSGGLSEKWAVTFHGSAEMLEKNRNSPTKIAYADLADIVKMLNQKTGGALQDVSSQKIGVGLMAQ